MDDHCTSLLLALERSVPGQSYNIGGSRERRNIEVVEAVCRLLDELATHATIRDHGALIRSGTDRPGYDFRYAVDASKIKSELGWHPAERFESGLRKTVQWYVANSVWCERVTSGAYRGERLGLSALAGTNLPSTAKLGDGFAKRVI